MFHGVHGALILCSDSLQVVNPIDQRDELESGFKGEMYQLLSPSPPLDLKTIFLPSRTANFNVDSVCEQG